MEPKKEEGRRTRARVMDHGAHECPRRSLFAGMMQIDAEDSEIEKEFIELSRTDPLMSASEDDDVDAGERELRLNHASFCNSEGRFLSSAMVVSETAPARPSLDANDENENGIPVRLVKTRPICIICNEDCTNAPRKSDVLSDDDSSRQRKRSRRRVDMNNARAFVGSCQPSTAPKDGGGTPPTSDNRPSIASLRRLAGVHVAHCGHAVHRECCESYLASVLHHDDRILGRREEFKCPCGQCLSNCLVPFIDVGVDRVDPPMCNVMTIIKYLYSMALLIFSVVIVMAAMFTSQTKIAQDYGPAVAFFLFWFLILWLAMMEGGQGCLVGLQPVDKNLYKDSHPVTYKNTVLVHRGDNMERFIVGRQFLNVLVITVINLCGASVKNAQVLGLSDLVIEVFLGAGVAMILTTIMLGQLTAQVNAANCMLDFINNYFMLFTCYVSFGIEFSGLLHSVYLVQIFFSKITGKPIASNEPPRTGVQNLFFWVRVIMSLAILGFCFAVTLVALFDGQTTMYEGVPPYVSVIIFFLLMAVVGMMEGMQIALFAVVNLPEDEIKNYAIAHKVYQLTFSGTNLQSFLVGRQICVATCMFVVARIASPSYGPDDANIFGVSDGFQAFLNTGLTGAMITTLVGSLAWRLVASSFPIAFLSNPIIYVVIRICLVLDSIGLCSGAWFMAWIHKKLVGMKVDEVYIGKLKEPVDEECLIEEPVCIQE